MLYPFELPKLEFSYGALEPFLDEKTMIIHYTKHHQTYVDNLNAVLKDFPELHKKTLEDLIINIVSLPEKAQTGVKNQGGGVLNHNFYWKILSPDKDQKPSTVLLNAINTQFGSFEGFKEEFSSLAKKLFGSGWVWLSVDKQGKFVLSGLSNQESPLSHGLQPLLCIDVWEHAYYLKYQNRRAEFIENWWHVVNWRYVSHLYEQHALK
jgi:Fe-Mn family superoxide dismutase